MVGANARVEDKVGFPNKIFFKRVKISKSVIEIGGGGGGGRANGEMV